MPKIDYAELSAVANSVNGAVIQMSESLENVKSGANDLINTSELVSPAWNNTKNYFRTYPVISEGIWNSAMTVSETLTSYLSAFQSEVGSPKNQLDTDKLEELQSKLTAIHTNRRNLIESMSKAEDYVLSNLSNRLGGLDSSVEYFTKEIEVLNKYKNFEASHGNDFDSVKGTISELKTGMSQISTQKHFNPIQGYAPVNYQKMDWYNKVSVFNSEQPETRVVEYTRGGQHPITVYKVYKNGVHDKELSDKYTQIMLEKGLEQLMHMAGELSGVYDGYRFFVGKDPITGENITLEEWLQAGFWTALELLSAAKMIDMLNNIKLNKKLLNGIALTEDELRLFSKMDDLGAYKTIEKIDDIITDGSHYVDGKLKPNAIYMTGEHKYLYETDSFGRIVNVNAENLQLKLHEGRLKHDPKTWEKLSDDHAGHLIADMFGGSPQLDNLISQAKDVNKKEYFRLEMEWKRALENGQNVSVDIKLNYEGSSMRPSSFEVDYIIDGVPDSKIIPNVNN